MRLQIIWGICFFTLALCVFDDEFVKAYFRIKSLKFGNVFICESQKEQKRALKSLLELDIPIGVKKIDFNLSQAMFRDFWDDRHIGVVLDGDCLNLKAFFEECNSLKIFDYTHHFLLTTSSHAIVDQIADLWLNINSDFKLGITQGTSRILYDVYKPSSKYGSRLNVTYFGMYERKNGFSFRPKRPLYEERKNFTGIEFKTFTVLPFPYQGTVGDYIRSDVHVEINSFNRINSLFMVYCGDYYNFTLKMGATDSWGYPQPNGSFDGIVGTFEDGTSDFSGSPIFQTKERFVAVDYGRMTWRMLSAFVFRHPKHTDSFDVFLRPLSAQVWLFVMVSGLIIAVILKCALKFEMMMDEDGQLGVEASWSSLVLFLIGALCQQGSASLPLFISGRIVTIYVFVFAVLLYQFYSGSIVSFLLMEPPRTLRTVQQLARSDLKIACEDIMYNRIYFKDILKNKELSRLQEKPYKAGSPFFIPNDIGLPLVDKGGFAFHVELATAYPIIEKTFSEKAICDLEEIPLFDAKGMHAAFPKKSPNREMINYVLQKAGERGVLNRQVKHFHARKPACIGAETATNPVGIDEFYPALVILFMGILLSLTVLALEICLSSNRKIKNQSPVVPFVN